jgi:alcohol dehydrogenase class IV
MNPFDIGHWPNRIVCGPGAVAKLGALAAELGARRALVVCGSTVARGEMLARACEGLGAACAGVFDRVEAQSPLPCVRAGAAMARELGADLIVSVGGGSAIDAAKCMVMMLASGGDLAPYLIEYGEKDSMARKRLGDNVLPHIAVPTTTGSSSEAMPSAGCRDPHERRKLLFMDAALVPKVVVLDPQIAAYASPELTAHSGMTAVARCVEALYSARRNPVSTALALHAARLLRHALPRSVAAPHDLEARAQCQIACLMSGVAAINAMASVVHAIGHVFGGRFGLQHGVAHSILLAPAMRLLLPEIGEDQYDLLEALGIERQGLRADQAGSRAAASIEALVAQLPLRQRLRDSVIGRDDLPEIARIAMDDYMIPNAPRAVSEADLLALLQSAW